MRIGASEDFGGIFEGVMLVRAFCGILGCVGGGTISCVGL